MDKQTVECPLCRIGKYPFFSYSGSGACDHCGAVWTYDEGDTLTEDSLRRLLEKVPRWIPVSERLPEVGEPVLCCWSRQKIGMGVAMRRDLWGKVAWTNVDQWDEIDEPIAWMPLPEPPEVTP